MKYGFHTIVLVLPIFISSATLSNIPTTTVSIVWTQMGLRPAMRPKKRVKYIIKYVTFKDCGYLYWDLGQKLVSRPLSPSRTCKYRIHCFTFFLLASSWCKLSFSIITHQMFFNVTYFNFIIKGKLNILAAARKIKQHKNTGLVKTLHLYTCFAGTYICYNCQYHIIILPTACVI